jgi:RecB family endonuclease NucS
MPAYWRKGLTIVGRQFMTAAGPLDLLARDPQGRWVVIEIKRGVLRRETVAQALDYAACLAAFPSDELRIELLLI